MDTARARRQTGIATPRDARTGRRAGARLELKRSSSVSSWSRISGPSAAVPELFAVGSGAPTAAVGGDDRSHFGSARPGASPHGPLRTHGVAYPRLDAVCPSNVHQSEFVGTYHLRGGVRFRRLHSLDVTTTECGVEPLVTGMGGSGPRALGTLAAVGDPEVQAEAQRSLLFGKSGASPGHEGVDSVAPVARRRAGLHSSAGPPATWDGSDVQRRSRRQASEPSGSGNDRGPRRREPGVRSAIQTGVVLQRPRWQNTNAGVGRDGRKIAGPAGRHPFAGAFAEIDPGAVPCGTVHPQRPHDGGHLREAVCRAARRDVRVRLGDDQCPGTKAVPPSRPGPAQAS
jgi:hypothetical protein